jgi:type III restriction enzyme
MDEWVRAVNGKGGFGLWSAEVAYEPAQVHDILANQAAVSR